MVPKVSGSLTAGQVMCNCVSLVQILLNCWSVVHLSRFKGSRKDEVLGITPNRLIRIDLGVGDVVKTWRYNNMRQWNVNWDIRQVN